MNLIMMKKCLIHFRLFFDLFDSNASSFNQEATIEDPSFYVSLEGDFSPYDTIDEK